MRYAAMEASGRRRRGRLFAILLVAMAALGAIWVAARNAGILVSFDDAPSRGLLVRLARGAELGRAAGPLMHTPEDGTLADTSDQDFLVASMARAEAGLVEACATQGLHPPGPVDRRIMPNIICQGRWGGQGASVHLSGRCGSRCRVTLETRVI